MIAQIDLFDALLAPDLHVDLFNLQKMGQPSIRLDCPKKLGIVWMLNKLGDHIGSLDESVVGRPTRNCRIVRNIRPCEPIDHFNFCTLTSPDQSSLHLGEDRSTSSFSSMITFGSPGSSSLPSSP